MIKQYQEKADDCLSACIASILEISIKDVPNFVVPGEWRENVQRWLNKRGFALVQRASNLVFDIPYIASMKHKYRPFRHAVIWKNGKILHDPSKVRSTKMLCKKPVEFFYVVKI